MYIQTCDPFLKRRPQNKSHFFFCKGNTKSCTCPYWNEHREELVLLPYLNKEISRSYHTAHKEDLSFMNVPKNLHHWAITDVIMYLTVLLWKFLVETSQKLQFVQNTAAWILTGASKADHITLVLCLLTLASRGFPCPIPCWVWLIKL